MIGRTVHLDWIDGDFEIDLSAEDAERAKVCLASIGWRDFVDEAHHAESLP